MRKKEKIAIRDLLLEKVESSILPWRAQRSGENSIDAITAKHQIESIGIEHDPMEPCQASARHREFVDVSFQLILHVCLQARDEDAARVA